MNSLFLFILWCNICPLLSYNAKVYLNSSGNVNVTVKHQNSKPEEYKINDEGFYSISYFPGEILEIQVQKQTDIRLAVEIITDYFNYSTNSYHLWKIENRTIKEEHVVRPSKDEISYLIGNDYTQYTFEKYIIFSFIFQNEPRCKSTSSVIINTKNIVEINLQTYAYDLFNNIIDIIVPNPPLYGQLSDGEKKISINTSFSSSTLNYSIIEDGWGSYDKIPFKGTLNGTETSICFIEIFNCHESCLECNYQDTLPTGENTLCLSCKNEYYEDEIIKGNCISKAKPKCKSNCIDCYYDDFQVKCSQCQPSYKLFQYQCYEECPNGTVTINNSCELIQDFNFMNITLKETYEMIRKNIKYFSSALNNIQGENYTIEISSLTNNHKDYLNKTSYINFTECASNLSLINSVNLSDLYIFKSEIVNNKSLTNTVKFQILTSEGTIIDPSICGKVNYTHQINSELADLDKINEFSKHNIDLLNENDPFFHSICSLNSDYEEDLSLSVREEDFSKKSKFVTLIANILVIIPQL